MDVFRISRKIYLQKRVLRKCVRNRSERTPTRSLPAAFASTTCVGYLRPSSCPSPPPSKRSEGTASRRKLSLTTIGAFPGRWSPAARPAENAARSAAANPEKSATSSSLVSLGAWFALCWLTMRVCCNYFQTAAPIFRVVHHSNLCRNL